MEHKTERQHASLTALSAKQHFALFVDALFQTGDLVEIRAIRTATANDSDSSPVTLRRWLTKHELSDSFPMLRDQNENGSNIYFGVNPRVRRAGTKADIQSCSVLWADLDECCVADARAHWQRVGIEPTLVVSSGHGVHLYWKLREKLDLQSDTNRGKIEGLLKAFYADLGSDSTQDITRLLRLPGFRNVKREPVPCCVTEFNPQLTFTLNDFANWQTNSAVVGSENQPQFRSLKLPSSLIRMGAGDVDMRRVRGLVGTLDRDTDDRSRRDFWVVCQLLRLGLSAEEVCQLVQGHSKFQTSEYTSHTVQKALASLA